MSPVKRVVAWSAAWLALAAIAWFRLDGLARGTIWAEDGRDFLGGALRGNSVFEPYEGYAHVVPRILAELTVRFAAVADFAVAIAALTVLVAAGIGLLVFGLTAGLGLSRGARAGLALLTVLAPALTTEVSGNAANLHWMFLWLAPWLLLARPTTWVRAVLLGGVAFLAAATEIQLLLFLPLLLVDVRDRRRWPLAAGALLGAAVQMSAFLIDQRTSQDGHPSIMSAMHGYALQVGGGAWMTPITPLTSAVADHGWWVAYALLVPFVLTCVWLLLTNADLRVLVMALVIGSVVIWTAGFMMNLGRMAEFAAATPEQIRTIGPLRHAVVPSMFLLAVAVLAADRVRRGVGVAIVATLIVVATWSTDGRGASHRSAGPSWADAVAGARVTCEQTTAASVTIHTAPAGPLWVLPIDCRRLLSDD